MNGYGYRLRLTNCCFIVSLFIESALLPYLIELFGNARSETYWLNRDTRCAEYWRLNNIPVADKNRFSILKHYYYKYNPKNPKKTIFDAIIRVPDEEAILIRWTLFKLYYSALVHSRGPNQTRLTLRERYSSKRPDDIMWHPLRLQRYANFAKAIMEEVGNKSVQVPYIYKTAWDNYGNSKSEERQVPSVENFRRADISEQPVSERRLRF